MSCDNAPAASALRFRTDGSWWRLQDDDFTDELKLTARSRGALLLAGCLHLVDVLDVDLERLGAGPGVGARTVAEIALLRDVLRYRFRVPEPSREAFEADLPGNRIPPSLSTVRRRDPIHTLDLSKRARSALAAAGAANISDLLDLTLVDLRSQPGVGPGTERELEDLLSVLFRRFATGPGPRAQSVDALFEAIWPRFPKRLRADFPHAVLERYLGLHPGLGPWPTLARVAADLGVTPGAVRYRVEKARRVWSHPTLLRIGHALKEILGSRRGHVPLAELAEDVLRRRGSAAQPALARRRAGAVIRAGIEGQRSGGAAPRMRAYRWRGEVFVAFRGE